VQRGQGKLTFLGGVVLAAWTAFLIARWTTRSRIPNWEQPRRVAIVVQSVRANNDAFARRPIEELIERLPALETQLNFEYSRYREGKGPAFRFTAFGPIFGGESPPPPEAITGVWKYLLKSQDYASKLAARAELDPSDFDSIVYVVVMDWVPTEPLGMVRSKPVPTFSIARVQIDDDYPDRPLFVVARKLLHTLGAYDKLNSDGDPSIPNGLGDPEQNPLYPQVYANVMAGKVVVYPDELELPKALRQLSIAPDTAREIGWVVRQP
jgi:hypothetical protein